MWSQLPSLKFKNFKCIYFIACSILYTYLILSNLSNTNISPLTQKNGSKFDNSYGSTHSRFNLQKHSMICTLFIIFNIHYIFQLAFVIFSSVCVAGRTLRLELYGLLIVYIHSIEREEIYTQHYSLFLFFYHFFCGLNGRC